MGTQHTQSPHGLIIDVFCNWLGEPGCIVPLAAHIPASICHLHIDGRIQYLGQLGWGRWAVVLVAKLCPTLCDSIDGSLPGSSVHGISQARILEWVVISFSRGSSRLRNWTHISCIGRQIFLPLSHQGSPAGQYKVANCATQPSVKNVCPRGWGPRGFRITHHDHGAQWVPAGRFWGGGQVNPLCPNTHTQHVDCSLGRGEAAHRKV